MGDDGERCRSGAQLSADPFKSPTAAVQNFVDELNQTLRKTVTQMTLHAKITGAQAHLSFNNDEAIRLDDDHWLYISYDQYIGGRDPEGQYRSHTLKAIFSYHDSPLSDSEAVLSYHFHKLEVPTVGSALVPHVHVRDSVPLHKKHIFIGRSCVEDLLEFLVTERGVPVVPQDHPAGNPLTEDELRERTVGRLHESRRLFHEKFKSHPAITPLDELPEEAQAILARIR